MDEIPCQECGGNDFEIFDGLKICTICSTEVEGYLELDTQEESNVIDHSRLVHVGIEKFEKNRNKRNIGLKVFYVFLEWK